MNKMNLTINKKGKITKAIIEEDLSKYKPPKKGIDLNEWEQIRACEYYLIRNCVKLNATHAVQTLESITMYGKKIGSWKITIEKIKDK